ncbi:TetR/AcrR family transcriptional regulator [Nocardia inohanensis]|uniref:TetR/AcrR family transcriptional regulator n=1 Tax=Nocardia inohanensis TaxID=209246 RepID=UPI001C3F7FA9|nr:TetR/AcrR family transcriptional regulator [Nocardia inohanensis]
MSVPQARTPGRRAQQRAEARIALLDATIESLIRHGYAATTTRGVAELAGVSQGKQQHYYPTKAELVKAAALHLAQVFTEAIRAEPPEADSEHDRAMRMIDALWLAAGQPLTNALLEFVAAARTDTGIAATVGDMLERMETMAYSLFRDMTPTLAAAPGARDWLRISASIMCAAVAVTALPGGAHLAAGWGNIRETIEAGLIRLTER